MKKLKVDFKDFWIDFNKNDNIFLFLLNKEYDIILDNNPDIIITGNKHERSTCFLSSAAASVESIGGKHTIYETKLLSYEKRSRIMRYNRFCGWPRVPPPKGAVLPGYVVALSFKTPEIRTDADRIVSMCVESP